MTTKLIDIGVVVGVKPKQALVRVDLLGHITDWLPVMQQANSFKRRFTSLREGQQVVVLNNRVVIGSIYNRDCPEPDGSNEHVDVVEYEDGTRIVYDTKAKILTVNNVGDIQVTCVNASITADTATLDAETFDVTAETTFNGDITHNGKFTNSDGIETQGSIKDKKGDLTSHGHPKVSPR